MRLMIYDDTCRGRLTSPNLTEFWFLGSHLYKALDRIDHARPVRTWSEALEWLATVRPEEPIDEIQFWGHGKWGEVFIDGAPLDARALSPEHEHHAHPARIRERIRGPQSLWWFRTCETFGCRPGMDFAEAWVDFFECRAAGHTFIIGPWQSGLHTLSPGQRASWPKGEGLSEGTPDEPLKALWSGPTQPNTITCLHNTFPDAW